jgi:transcriptional regulator with XRE-family HTH domain
MFGLNKSRTKLGSFLDRHGITQEELSNLSGLSRDGISRLCDGNKSISPNENTVVKIVGALRRKGHNVTIDDFWG